MNSPELPDFNENNRASVILEQFDLKESWKTFILFYCMNPNIAQAAKKAGVSRNQGYKIYAKEEVKKAIFEIRKVIAEKFDLTIDAAMNELARIAMYDSRDHIENITESGVTFKPFSEMDTRVMASINQKSTSDGLTYVEIKTYDKLKALELIKSYLENDPSQKNYIPMTKEQLDQMDDNQVAARYKELK